MSGASNGFVKLPRDVLRSEQWHTLSTGSRCLLLDIWSRFNGRNNGSIQYSQRQCQAVFRCSSKTAVRWFKELEERGFLIATRRGDFHVKAGEQEKRATLWRILVVPKNDTGAAR